MAFALYMSNAPTFATSCEKARALMQYAQAHHLRRVHEGHREIQAARAVVNSFKYYAGLSAVNMTRKRMLFREALENKNAGSFEFMTPMGIDCDLPNLLRHIISRFNPSDEEVWGAWIQGYLETMDPHSLWLKDATVKDAYFHRIKGSGASVSYAGPAAQAKPSADSVLRLKVNELYAAFPSHLERTAAESNPKVVLMDLRHAKGGIFEAVAPLIDMFIDEGPIAELFDRNERSVGAYRIVATHPGAQINVPCVVLMGRQTASFAELFVGSLKSLDHVFLLGQRTSGKATVAESVDILGEKYMMTKYAIRVYDEGTAKYVTYHHKGVLPDLEIPLRGDSTLREASYENTVMLPRTRHLGGEKIIAKIRARSLASIRKASTDPEEWIAQKLIEYLGAQGPKTPAKKELLQGFIASLPGLY